MFFTTWQSIRPKLGSIRSTYRWAKSKFSPPYPSYIKQATILRHTWPGSIFIETGTFKGATSLFMKKHGFKVVTIEIHKPLYEKYSSYLKKFGIDPRLGDSAMILPVLLREYSVYTNLTIFLDGHYSGGITGQAEQPVPIIKEFESLGNYINGNPEKNITILIDDVRLFMPGGDPNYPPKSTLLEFSALISAEWSIENDIFICRRPGPSESVNYQHS